MARAPETSAPAAQARYRMRDLVDETGVNRETIRFYIAQGLLPEGQKTSRNMAWYSEEHLRRLRLIRQLQDEHFLPLRAIRTILDEQDDFHFSEAQNQVIAAVKRHLATGKMARQGRAMPLQEVLSAAPMEPTDLDELVEAGHLQLDEVAGRSMIGAEDAELIRGWSALRRAGLTKERGFLAADLEMMEAVVDILLKQELHIFEERIQEMSEDEAQAVFDQIIPAINRIFAVLHQRRARAFVESFFSGPVASEEKK